MGGTKGLYRALTVALVGSIFAVLLPPFPSAAALSSDESRLVALLNSDRAKAGLRTLAVASDLVEAARRHSQDMAARQAIYHDPNTPNEIRGWSRIGEVVGRGPSASDVHRGFMASSSHRAHLMNSGYTQVGAGTAWGGSGSSRRLYVTEIFVQRGGASRVSRAAPKRTAPRPRPVVRPAPRRPVAPPPPAPPPTPVMVEPTLALAFLFRLAAMDEGFARTAIPAKGPPPPE